MSQSEVGDDEDSYINITDDERDEMPMRSLSKCSFFTDAD